MLCCYTLLLEDQGDKARFQQVYHEKVDGLLRLARRFFPDGEGGRAHAEDAVEDAFYALARNFKKYLSLPRQERDPYLVVIVKNKCRDILRREKKYTGLEAWQEAPAPNVGTAREDCRRAVELIRALPDEQRAVLECRLLLGLDNKETARELGITESACSKRFERGREKVERQLREEGIVYE